MYRKYSSLSWSFAVRDTKTHLIKDAWYGQTYILRLDRDNFIYFCTDVYIK